MPRHFGLKRPVADADKTLGNGMITGNRIIRDTIIGRLFRHSVPRKLLVKTATKLLFIAVAPFLPGCMSTEVIKSAQEFHVDSRAYDSADRIEKAAVTSDDRLCLFFTKNSTGGLVSRFTLVIPRSLLRTNAKEQPAYATTGILLATNSDELYPQLSRLPDNPKRVKCMFTSATLHVPGATVQTNWVLLSEPGTDLKFIPVGATFNLQPYQTVAGRGLDLPLVSNATETVYLIRSAPIELGYVDLSIKRSLTIVAVDPLLTGHRYPQKYTTLIASVPADIVTLPFQIIGFGLIYWAMSNWHGC